MIGLLLAWPGALGGIALLDSCVMAQTQRQGALIEMRCELASEQGLNPQQVARLKSGQAIRLDRPEPSQLLADN
jgi:hypothetical protein